MALWNEHWYTVSEVIPWYKSNKPLRALKLLPYNEWYNIYKTVRFY